MKKHCQRLKRNKMSDPLLQFRIIMMAIVLLLTFFFCFVLYEKEEELG
jgi:hypothetical protein